MNRLLLFAGGASLVGLLLGGSAILLGLLVASAWLRPVPLPRAGNWQPDGTYHVNVDTVAGVEHLYESLDPTLTLQTAAEIEGLDAKTIQRLNAGCERRQGGAWAGYLIAARSPLPLASVCTGGPDVTRSVAASKCAQLQSRGRPMHLLSHTPRTFTCAE